MATQNPVNLGGLKAGADLRTKQYHAVKISAADTVVSCAATTDKPLGILQNDPNTDEEAVVCVGGTSKYVAGGVVANAAQIGTKADGRGQTAVATQYPIGKVVSAASGADGDHITVTVNVSEVPLA